MDRGGGRPQSAPPMGGGMGGGGMQGYGPPQPARKGGAISGVVFKSVDVTVPEGRSPGSRLVVQAEGKLVTAVVPDDAAPGDVFAINVPIELSPVRVRPAPRAPLRCAQPVCGARRSSGSSTSRGR